jgi:hypothetical protein
MPSNVKSKSAPHLDILLQDCDEVSAYGGAVLVDAIARDCGLWDHVRELSAALDHRSDPSRGNKPEVLIAQILTSFATGGFSIEDAGRLAHDPALGKLIGLDSMADASTLNLWLNRQTEQGVAALWEINRKLLAWVFKQLPKSTLCPNGKAEVFFDGTESRSRASVLKKQRSTTMAIEPTPGRLCGSMENGFWGQNWTQVTKTLVNTCAHSC